MTEVVRVSETAVLTRRRHFSYKILFLSGGWMNMHTNTRSVYSAIDQDDGLLSVVLDSDSSEHDTYHDAFEI
jgi:hypothetical protein